MSKIRRVPLVGSALQEKRENKTHLFWHTLILQPDETHTNFNMIALNVHAELKVEKRGGTTAKKTEAEASTTTRATPPGKTVFDNDQLNLSPCLATIKVLP